jgi:N-formylglutamate amidohydrolase
MDFKELLVVIPHSGILVPEEISVGSLSREFSGLMRDVDWYTNWLYDFRDILGNSHLEFPYCSLILEANRDPGNLTDSVPLCNRLGEPLYRSGSEPDGETRRLLARKYLVPFHRNVSRHIVRGKKRFMLDAHSTITSHGIGDNQIDLMNYQVSVTDNMKTYFCPDVFIETYASELDRKLPEVKVTINKSRFDNVYGHICGRHSVNSVGRQGDRVPAILQETNQKLYMNADGTPDIEAIETLRRSFAESLANMMKKVSSLYNLT